MGGANPTLLLFLLQHTMHSMAMPRRTIATAAPLAIIDHMKPLELVKSLSKARPGRQRGCSRLRMRLGRRCCCHWFTIRGEHTQSGLTKLIQQANTGYDAQPAGILQASKYAEVTASQVTYVGHSSEINSLCCCCCENA